MVLRNRERLAPQVVAGTWHTMEEAAVIARRSTTAMRQLRIKGRGPRFHKVDGRLLVSDSDLQAWLSGEDA
jgi:hypothetical protein